MSRRRHILIVALLVVFSGLVQAVVIRRARVASLDAVRFARIAQEIDSQGLLQALRTEQQPLFPAWVWVVHKGLLHTAGPGHSIWATAVQLAAAIPLVLTVVPVYLLVLRLTGRAAAVAAALLFCLLPEVARLGADGISDSLHLLFFCWAFWAMVESLGDQGSGVRDQELGGRRLGFLLISGVATGLAVLVRVEVLVLAAAFWVVWTATQLQTHRWHVWRRLAAGGACFALGLAAVLGPCLIAAGDVTPRTASARVLGRHPERVEASSPVATEQANAWVLPDGKPMAFDVKEPSVSSRRRGYSTAMVRFGRKLADAFGYWIGALALFGAWRLRGRRAGPADRFVQVFFVLYALIAVHFAATEGYLVPRHLLGLVVAGLAAAGVGALELGGCLQGLFGGWACMRLRSQREQSGLLNGGQARPLNVDAERDPGHGYPLVAWATVVMVSVACLPMTLIHLHDSRLGHRAAAAWLAADGSVPGRVLDSRGWTGLYSGRSTYLYDQAQAAFRDPHLAYVVLEKQELGFQSRRSRTLRALICAAAEPVGEFPEAALRRPNQQPVIVYRWHPDRLGRADGGIAREALAWSVSSASKPP